jgi:large subunit ribosomal protein L17
MASLVCHFINERRIRTTLQKARLARSLAEKMVTLGKEGTLAARRRAIATLRREDCVARLFQDIVPQFADRAGGYTRIVKLGRRRGDAAPTALLEWVNIAAVNRKKKREKPKEGTPEKK